MYNLETLKAMGLWEAVSLELISKYNLKSEDVECNDGCEEDVLMALAGKTKKSSIDLQQEICSMAENLEANRRGFWH